MNSSEECALLPLPEPVHTRDSPGSPVPTASGTPNSSRSPRSPRTDRDFRRQTYMRHIEMMMAMRSIPEDQEDPFLKYFNTQRVEYGEDASCVFLLWGPLATSQPSTCPVLKAIDIPIKRTNDIAKSKISEEKVFLDMKRAFYKHTKSWASYLGLRNVSAVETIKFRLIKLNEPGFLVSPMAVDFSEDRENCRMRIDEIEKQFQDYTNPEDVCYSDADNNGKYTHTHNMCGYVNYTLSLEPTCPFEEWSILKSRLDWIVSAAFLTYYFLYPDAAKDQVILSRPSRASFVQEYSSIKYQLQHVDERRYMVLDGLYVEEQWKIPLAIVLIITVLVVTCLTSILIWKSWEIVFGAASFVATAIMLVLAIDDS